MTHFIPVKAALGASTRQGKKVSVSRQFILRRDGGSLQKRPQGTLETLCLPLRDRDCGHVCLFLLMMVLVHCFCPNIEWDETDGEVGSEFEEHYTGGRGGDGGSGEGGDDS